MKLSKIAPKEPTVRMPVTVKKSTVEMVEAYRTFYAAHYSSEIEASRLIEEILLTFIKEDKAFQKSQKTT